MESVTEAHRAFVRAAAGRGSIPEPAAARTSAEGCPVNGGAAQACSSDSIAGAGCASSAADAAHASRINMPVVNNSGGASSSSAPPLSTARVASSIPIAAPQRPQHQEPGGDVWMYPSEQQFFNAMKRKGWEPSESDMTQVVAIHNSVNERAWQHVLAWEALHACECAQPRLARFRGRPNEYSPKARLLNFLGFKLPFDRHDWVVDRCGREVRYVIDFYSGAPQPGVPASMHLDVRPALDSPQALWDRLRMQASWVGSGRWLHE